MPLEHDVAAFLEQISSAEGPSMSEAGPDAAREMYRAMQSMNPVAEVASITDSKAGDIPIRIYRNSDDVTPGIVYFHGGGWVIGDLDTHDSVCTQLVEATGFTVISVDYRLAPEHPFPAPVDDCYQAFCWVAEHAVDLKIDAGRLAVAGDSAGGNLSTVVAMLARDQNGPTPAFQLLVYPVTNTAMNTASYEENAEGYLLTKDGMQWFWDLYIGEDDTHRNNTLAAPLLADNLAGLPPACILTAEFDPLRDEGEAYGEALSSAGVTTTVKRVDGTVHGFLGMPFKSSVEAMQFIASQLKAALT